MRELSIFIDESGVVGPLEPHSPFYIVSFVLHDQSQDITARPARLVWSGTIDTVLVGAAVTGRVER